MASKPPWLLVVVGLCLSRQTAAQDAAAEFLSEPRAMPLQSFGDYIPQAACPELISALTEQHKGRGGEKDLHQSPGMGTQFRREGDQCWSRSEWKCFHHDTPKDAPSAYLEHALHEYRRHSAACARADRGLHRMLLRGQRPRCKYFLWMTPAVGVGNAALGLVASFLFSLLSGRVMLAHNNTHRWVSPFAALLCEPFPDGPSWKYPGEMEEFYRRGLAQRFNYSAVCRGEPTPSILHWDTMDGHEFSPLLCSDLHEWAARASVLVGYGNQYFVTALWGAERYRAALQRMFPGAGQGQGQGPFSSLGPLILRPSNRVWAKATDAILGMQRTQMVPGGGRKAGEEDGSSAAPVRIGVQFRLFASLSDAEAVQRKRGVALDIVRRCLPGALALDLPTLESLKQLPCMSSDNHTGCPVAGPSANGTGLSLSEALGVYVATMDVGFPRVLSDELKSMGIAANIHRLTRTSKQKNAVLERNEDALAEVLVLALSTDLVLTTPGSTYGYIAAGFTQAPAFFLGSWGSKAPREPCFHTFHPPPTSNHTPCCDGAVPLQHLPAELQTCQDESRGITL